MKKHNRFRSNMSREQFDQLQGTEIKSKRTRFGKVFALGANRFQAVTYTDPVHRFNEKTHEWDEMDNRFSATPRMKEAKAAWKQGIMPAVAHGDVLLECKTGSMNVTCGMSGEAPFINLTDAEGRHLAWGIKDALSILPEADEISDTPAQNVRGMREKVMDHLHGEVAYNGIFAGVDLRCKLDRGFKDELVFAEKESVRPITFLLESEGRQMELNEQNMLIVKDEQGDAVFRLQAPFMEDANYMRGNVAVQLEARENGIYAMTYIPDADFGENAVYPVTLDPAVETTSENGGIVDTYVEKGYTDNRSALDRLWICDSGNRGKCNAYMRVAELPALGANHYITSAHLCVKNYAALDAETTLVMSEVLEDWNPATITYANQPARSALYQDCCTFPQKAAATASYLTYVWRELDVTSLARKWYLGENHGVVFTPAPTSVKDIALNSADGSNKPYFVVNYASLAGLESYLTYDGQSGGLAGTGAVSLVNGNLIFAHGDTSMNGNRMPVSVSHYYNSCDADKNEFGMGYGWRTSLHQTLHKEYINEEVMYVYTDGDGTEHWFELDEEADTTQYVDLSGLSLSLTIAEDGVITLTDKGDNRMVFPTISATPNAAAPVTAKVLITSLHDAVGNQITITPMNGAPLRIHSVTDGAGRVTTFTYSSNLCNAIMTPWQTADACTRFSYTNGKLTGITHEDDRTASYVYEVRNGYALLTSTTGTDGIFVTYAYSNTGAIDGLPHCVVSAVTKGTKDGVTLTAVNNAYTYGNHMALVKDNISGKTLRYHFNDNGNQVSIDDQLGYAVYTRYDQTGSNENAPINHATTRSRMQRVVRNLLQDSMFELDSSAWEKDTAVVTRDVSTMQWGIVSHKLAASSAGTYLRQNVSLTPGNSYTFSGYLRSGADKTFLRVSYTVNGVVKYLDSDPVQNHDNPSGKPFERVAVSFTLPSGADALVTCAVMCVGSSGYGWASCMQLEEGLTCNHFNMLQDQVFSALSTNSAAASCWRVNENTLSAYVSTSDLSAFEIKPPAMLTGRALHLAAHYNNNYKLIAEQELRSYGKAGDRFSVGGWASAYMKKHNPAKGVYCCIDVLFPGSSGWVSGGMAEFNYEEGCWQFACGSVTAPCDYNKLLVRVNMTGQMNYADVTGLFLYPEAFGTDFVYDAKGNPQESRKLYGATENAEYDDCDNLIRHTAPGHTKSSTFSYGDTEEQQKKHLMLESHSPLGTDSYFTYDAFGNATRSDTSGAVGNMTAITRSTAEFQHNGNYVHKQTDARGKTVTTEVDANKGITTRVTDPKGQAVEYEHDALRRVVKVKTTDGSREFRNEYTYDQTRGLLTGVKHNTDATTGNDVSYTFEYDALGRKTQVNVGNTTLSTNVYQNDPEQDHYGMLSQMQYGNGTVVKNEYDDFNRVTGVIYGTKSENAETATFEDNPRYEYAYNANGQVAHVRNNLIGQIAESEYDLSNRPCRIKTHQFTEDAAGNVTSQEHIYTGEVAYDDVFGRLSKFTEQVGADHEEFVTTFGYDDENRPTSLSYGDHGESTLEYDGLGRVAKATVKAGDGTANTTTYAYVAGAALSDVTDKTSTTGLVESIAQTGGNFTYTYDDNGNIVSVVQDGITTSYTYDALGQLIRVDDEQENATWVYAYDMGGNILSKQKYAYGVSTGTPVESKSFTYGNANWRDQLTAVDGVAITYDQIGNPLNDGTWTYTWENGRQLARMQSIDTDASFVYNENGLRVQKTVNGVVTDYTLHGKNIVHMTQGSNELHFFYDAQNKPAIVVYNGVPYSYVKNLQGDIVAILDSNKNVVVSYVYDAWGRPISCSGTMANTLGKINPFRYRGYVYDEETGLYYLRSRHYIPELCRFVNSDSVLTPNLFNYCGNNPVIAKDPSGYFLCAALYDFACNHAIKGAIYDFTDTPIGAQVQYCLANAPVFRSALFDAIQKEILIEGASTWPLKFEFAIPKEYYNDFLPTGHIDDWDLYMGVRACNVKVTIYPAEDSDMAQIYRLLGMDLWVVKYTISDDFDFHKLSPETGVANPIEWFNDEFGYKPQEAGDLNDYSWESSGTLQLLIGPGVFDLYSQ